MKISFIDILSSRTMYIATSYSGVSSITQRHTSLSSLNPQSDP